MTTRPRVYDFEVAVDQARVARSALGGSPFAREAEWWAEHLVLAGLVRCVLASMDHAARRAGLNCVASGDARATVTKREDGLYGFVAVEASLDVRLAPAPAPGTIPELVAKAEAGCFVGNSLSPKPGYRWVINGQEAT